MHFGEMTSREFHDGLCRHRTAILPLGSVEAHGAHLPLITDALIMERVAWAAARETDALVAPAFSYGLCRSTGLHPGTISLKFDTVRAVTRDIGRSLYDQGIRRLIIASGHAGGSHRAAMEEAGEDLLACCPELNIAVVTMIDLLKDRLDDFQPAPPDGHAGWVETSLIMHLAPGWVKPAEDISPPAFPGGILVRDKKTFWTSAVNGRPEYSTPELGRELFLRATASLIDLIGRLNTYAETTGSN